MEQSTARVQGHAIDHQEVRCEGERGGSARHLRPTPKRHVPEGAAHDGYQPIRRRRPGEWIRGFLS